MGDGYFGINLFYLCHGFSTADKGTDAVLKHPHLVAADLTKIDLVYLSHRLSEKPQIIYIT